MPVANKDGSIRLCVDFRKVNKVTVPDPYYIPMVGEIVDRVAGAQYLSKLDLNKGFHQVPLSEEAKQRAAIVTPFGKFQFTMMPFGMINATSTFQQLMDEVLRGKQDRCSAYIDDILIYWGEHLAHVKETLMCLRRARLKAKLSKCEWGKEQLEYLGHRIGGGIVEVPEARVKAMAEFRQPVTKKDVRAFLGTTGYYRKFIPGYGAVAAPLTAATRKVEPDTVIWTSDRVEAFQSLRKLIVNVCTLTIPLPDDQYRLQTDASVAGVGAVLSEVQDGVEKPTAFFSRQLTAAEKNYTASELECLGIITAVRHFEVYLTGRNFALVTDHQALQGLRTSRHLNRRLTRWAMFLQDYDFDLQYRPGS